MTERWGLEGWAGVDGHLWQEPPEGWAVQVSVGEPGGRWAGPGNVQGRGGGGRCGCLIRRRLEAHLHSLVPD